MCRLIIQEVIQNLITTAMHLIGVYKLLFTKWASPHKIKIAIMHSILTIRHIHLQIFFARNAQRLEGINLPVFFSALIPSCIRRKN
jgi:hypothetical protein